MQLSSNLYTEGAMAVKKRLPKIQPSVLKSDLDPVKVRQAIEAVIAARLARERQARARSR
jgi:hypothetical protein